MEGELFIFPNRKGGHLSHLLRVSKRAQWNNLIPGRLVEIVIHMGIVDIGDLSALVEVISDDLHP